MMRQMSLQTMGTALAATMSSNGASSYEPLTSVWEGSDGDLRSDAQVLSDDSTRADLGCSYNAGKPSR